ncbi:MAG: PadR family transcriptional regulator [Proteobacteria bacterium]|nr:PadR family transcriptional regulator [Pseudomonadota bacterium]
MRFHSSFHGHSGHHHPLHGQAFGRHGGRHFGRHGRDGWDRSDDDRGGRRRRVFDSSELRLVLLKLIADQPRHGYDLIRAVEELTGGVYVPSPGVVYPTLTLLQEMGHIDEAASEGARRAFAITAQGTAHLAEKKTEVEALFVRLAQLDDARERHDGGPVRRAMQNLKMALRDRFARFNRDDVEAETLHKVAAILDEAAQKIERL